MKNTAHSFFSPVICICYIIQFWAPFMDCKYLKIQGETEES